LGSTQKKSDAGREPRPESLSRLFPQTLLSPAPLAPCGRRVGGEGAKWSTRESRAANQSGDFFWVHPKKGSARPHCGPAKIGPPARPRSLARYAYYFASQSMPEKSFAATSPRHGCCNKLKKFLRVIRAHLGTLRLGTSSGASGDFQLTRSSLSPQAVDRGISSWTKPDVCRVDWRRRQPSSVPTASVETTGVGKFVCADRSARSERRRNVTNDPQISQKDADFEF